VTIPVKCENCGKLFATSETGLKKRAATKGIDELYFDCPHCKETFLVLRTNGMIRCLQKKQTALEDKVKAENRTLNMAEYNEWVCRQKNIKIQMDKLNGKVINSAK